MIQIHRFVCVLCGAECRADRLVCCYKCGCMMEQDEIVGELDADDYEDDRGWKPSDGAGYIPDN